MTIDTVDFNCPTRLVIEATVAMRVLSKMTVDTMHALLGMNVIQMDGFVELISIVGPYDFVVSIEQVAFAVALKDFAEHPSMAVKVAKLRVLQLAVEFRRT